MTDYACPDAVIVAVHEEPGLRRHILIVNVRCPHCGHVHIHGAGPRDNPSSGIAYCIPTGTDTSTLHSYVLTDPNGLLP
jgi:hypothetical protein